MKAGREMEEGGGALPNVAVSLLERARTIRALPLPTSRRASLDLLMAPNEFSPIKEVSAEVCRAVLLLRNLGAATFGDRLSKS